VRRTRWEVLRVSIEARLEVCPVCSLLFVTDRCFGVKSLYLGGSKWCLKVQYLLITVSECLTSISILQLLWTLYTSLADDSRPSPATLASRLNSKCCAMAGHTSSKPGCLPTLICFHTLLIASEARMSAQCSRKKSTCTFRTSANVAENGENTS